MKHQIYPHIFSPITIGEVTFKNRIFTAPSLAHMTQRMPSKFPEPSYIANYLEKAKGGAACVACGGQPVERTNADSKVHAKFDIGDPQGWRNFIHMTNAIHFYDAKCSYELLHFGAEGEVTGEQRNKVNYACSNVTRSDGVVFTEMPYEEMVRLADKYAYLAECVLKCGFDSLLIHGGHGTLLQEFVSPWGNKRTDEFGGPMANRAKFPIMVLDKIREKVGRKLLIEYRISGSECVPGGFEVEDCIEFAKLIQDKIDILHVSAGVVREPRLRAITHPSGFLGPGCNAYLAAAVKACPDIHVPVLTLGAFQEPDLIEATLAEGKADIVAMARGTIADPYTPNKAKCGKKDDIVPCIKCFHCLDEFKDTHYYSCAVNPVAGREEFLDMLIPKEYEKKNVAIIGGGPAGMRTALIASERGHKVTLFEKENILGGQLNDADFMSFKYDLRNYKNYLIRQLEKHGIDVRLGVNATPEMIEAMGFDKVIAAMGARPLIPPIPGVDGANVIWAGDSFHAPEKLGQKLVVIGGGQVGCETGVHYGMAGKDVTILEMLPQLAKDAMRTYREELVGQVGDHCKGALVGCRCTGINEKGVSYVDPAGDEQFIEADTVILAAGMRAKGAEAESFRECAPEFRKIGDCDRVGNVKLATRAAFEAAMTM